MALRDRLPKHDTLSEFEQATYDRFIDSLALAGQGRRHGAMYLLGYSVELTLKTAFFRSFGFSMDEPIRPVDLRAAVRLAREDLRVAVEPESLHNPVFWAMAIIRVWDHFGATLPAPLLREPTSRAHRIHANWSVSMRYARNASTLNDWTLMQNDALWILKMGSQLVIRSTRRVEQEK
jgi:hypothetical protein